MLAQLETVLSRISPEDTEALLDDIQSANRIFIVGRGRTGMIAGMLAMRLMHLGLPTYVVGEITTPRITSKDLLVACSGSGEVRMVHQMVGIAHAANARTVLITYNPKSAISAAVNRIVTIPVKLEAEGKRNTTEVVFPLGSRFEESLLLYLDLVVLYLMRRMSITELEMANRHTNLE
jgi:6-phospho-3-hexuloisomerase